MSTAVRPTPASLSNAIQPYLSQQDASRGILGWQWEGNATAVPNSNNFVSLGIIQLNNIVDTVFAEITATGGTLPTGGMQVQILGAATTNSPFFTAFTWAQLISLPGQIVTPNIQVGGSATFMVNVRGWYAIDFQVSATSGYSTTGQNYVGGYRD